MNNIITNRIFLRNYLVFMLVVALVHFILFHFRYNIGLLNAFTDAMLSIALLDFMLLSMWWVVRFARSDALTSFSSIRNSVLAGFFIVLTWLFLSRWLLELMFQTQHEYLEFLKQSQPLRFIAGLFVACLVYLSFFLSLYRRSVIEALERENQLRMLVQKTELQALKNQLNPHFIYNSLNSISSLTLYSPDKAREMVGLLSDFLRTALRQDAMQKVSLQQELDNISLYLQIEKIRFEEKLQWEFHIPRECMSMQLPVMILQPLVENAVKHGVQHSAQTSPLQIIAEMQESKLQVLVQNNFDPDFHRFKGEGVGVENVRNRMKVIYGKKDLVQIHVDGKEFKVNMQFPQ